jgi:hypothetical protein
MTLGRGLHPSRWVDMTLWLRISQSGTLATVLATVLAIVLLSIIATLLVTVLSTLHRLHHFQ